MRNGIVMEVEEKVLIVMTTNGEFLKIRKEYNIFVGETIYFSEGAIIETGLKNKLHKVGGFLFGSKMKPILTVIGILMLIVASYSTGKAVGGKDTFSKNEFAVISEKEERSGKDNSLPASENRINLPGMWFSYGVNDAASNEETDREEKGSTEETMDNQAETDKKVVERESINFEKESERTTTAKNDEIVEEQAIVVEEVKIEDAENKSTEREEETTEETGEDIEYNKPDEEYVAGDKWGKNPADNDTIEEDEENKNTTDDNTGDETDNKVEDGETEENNQEGDNEESIPGEESSSEENNEDSADNDEEVVDETNKELSCSINDYYIEKEQVLKFKKGEDGEIIEYYEEIEVKKLCENVGSGNNTSGGGFYHPPSNVGFPINKKEVPSTEGASLSGVNIF